MIYHCYQHTNYKRVTAFQEILVNLLPFRTQHLVRKFKENLRLRIFNCTLNHNSGSDV